MRLCLDCMNIINHDEESVCPFCGSTLSDSAPKEAYHLTPGITLKSGRYIVGRAVGYGGFGVTYAGFDTVLEKRVAIKEYLPSELATRYPGTRSLSVFNDGDSTTQFEKGLSGFVSEAQRLAKFSSVPGIVSIYDTFRENDTAYLVMELLDGETLKAYLAKKGKLSYDETMKIILPVLGALQQVHKEGIIHRDISPDNIFLTTDGQVKLLDFGAARYANVNASKSLSVILKPGYAPPEQYRSKGAQGSWSDVYAVGATIYRMLTGIVPEESMERAAKDNLKLPSRLGVKLPKNGETAIMNALNINAQNRVQTAAELESMLLGTTKAIRIEEKQNGKAWMLPKWLKWTACGIVAAGMLFVILLLTGAIKLGKNAWVSNEVSNSIAAPNLVGDEIESARKKLDEYNAGLEISIISAEYDDLIPAGTIQSQIPEYGTIIDKNTSIEVILSRGKEEDIASGAVPFLLGISMDEAERQLRELGYEVTITERHDQIYAKGTVCETNPEANTALEQGETVELVISLGASVTGVQIEPTSTEIETGSTMQLSVIIEPANAENKTVTWTSSDPSIVTVDESGKITAGSSEGRAKITVTTEDGGHTAVCKVTVKANSNVTPQPTETHEVWGEWSEWSETVYTPSDTRQVQSRREYRYRDKETTTSNSPTLSGWTLYNTQVSWSEYGSWSNWSETVYYASESRQVQTKTQYSYRTISYSTEYTDWGNWSSWSTNYISSDEFTDVETTTGYAYYYFQCPSCGAHMHGWDITCPRWAGGCGNAYIPESSWHSMYNTAPWSACQEWHGTGHYYQYINGELWFKWTGGETRTMYRYRTRSSYTVTHYSDWSAWQDDYIAASSNREVRTRLLYRYRDRMSVYTYYFYRYGNWSSWGTTPYTESNNRQVETRTVYRYRDKR